MPYRRAYKKRYNRKPYRPGYKACGSMVLSDAQRALYKVNKLKNLLNVEYKHHNILAQNSAIPQTGLITNLSLLSQGDTALTRDGGSVKFTSFRLSYALRINSSATQSPTRVMVVHDKQSNQAQFTLADLLFDATAVDAVFSPINVNNASRFNILYDKLHCLNIGSSASGICRVINKKLNMKTRYDGNDGTVADLSQDSMTLIFISVESTNTPDASFNYRSRFIDN